MKRACLVLVVAAAAACSGPTPVVGTNQPVDPVTTTTAATAGGPTSASRPAPTASTPTPSPAAYTYRDYSVPPLSTRVPVGWTVARPSPDRSDFRDPAGALLLRLVDVAQYAAEDQVVPTLDAYAQQFIEASRGDYPGYNQLKAGPAHLVGTGYTARGLREWSFTFVADGVERTVLVGFTGYAGDGQSAVDAVTQGYVYFSAPTESFDRARQVYDEAVSKIHYAG